MKKQVVASVMLFCICQIRAGGQDFNLKDTIRIPEVVIRKTTDAALAGSFPGKADSIAMKTSELASIGDILNWYFPTYIKSNGPGGINIATLRGASPSQTVVQWNGININNPMLGQSDLSILQSVMSDEISVSSGAQPGTNITGTIGGTINLNNRPDWQSRTAGTVSSSAGSYGRLSSGFRLATGTEKLQAVTRGSLSYSRNNFKYEDPLSTEEGIRIKREHAAIFQKDFMQELYLKRNNYRISSRLWYQAAERSIPSPVIVPQSGDETQEDESFRIMLDLDHSGNTDELSVKTALSVNRLDYTNKSLSVISNNVSRTWFLNTSYRLNKNRKTGLELILENELTNVSSNNYLNVPVRFVSSLAVIADRKLGHNIKGSLLIKELFTQKEFMSPSFSAMLEIQPFNYNNLSFFSGLSRNIRIPTMNELYWMPGGNSELQNESALMYEAGTRLIIKSSEKISLKSETVLYHNNIKNMIHWHPSEYSYWIAGNGGNVRIRGIEADLHIRADLDRILMELSGSYSYKRAMKKDMTDEYAPEMQLLYMPVNQANSSFTIHISKLYVRMQMVYTGRRYITTDNSEFLPSYTLLNMLTGVTEKKGKNSLSMNLRIENILNATYQSVKWYPQPGTAWVLTASYNFNNTNTK